MTPWLLFLVQGTVTQNENHPATAHKAGESSCGDGKFLISSLHQPCQPFTFITQ